MSFWMARLLQHRLRQPRPRVFFRPRLEVLEERLVPALTYHGGAVIPNVQAQAVFLGSNWNQTQTTPFNSFLQSAAGTTAQPSAFLNMLGAAGFSGENGTVRSGTTLSSVIDPVAIPVTNLSGYNSRNPLASANYTKTVLFDSQIQADLTAAIAAGKVQAPNPDGDTLYAVFVEPNVVVDVGNGQNSINTFSAYHNYFTYDGVAVAYSVTPSAGPIAGSRYANSQAPFLSAFDSMTLATSHELAESVTDPQLNAWYDASGNEVGDIVNASTVYLNGNAVQRVSAVAGSRADYLDLIPAGATAGHSVVFALSSGVLTKQEAGGSPVVIATGVASISPQSIDDFGQPMIDFVLTNGNAYEYHDFLPGNSLLKTDPGFFPITFLSSNVNQAAAGQGVSYVLLKNGNLGEYVDPNYATLSYGFGVNPTPTGTAVIASGVTSLNGAGLDASGGNTISYTANGVVHQFDDVSFAGTAHAGSKTAPSRYSFLSGFLFAGPTFPAGSFTPASPVIVAPPAAVPTNNQITLPPAAPLLAAPLNRVDGGGSEVAPTNDESTAAVPLLPVPPGAPATLADVPLFGPLFKEAAGEAKTVRSMVPATLWQTPPAIPGPAPAAPKGAPEGKAPAPNRLRAFTASALAAVFGFAGLIHEERRRQRPRQ